MGQLALPVGTPGEHRSQRVQNAFFKGTKKNFTVLLYLRPKAGNQQKFRQHMVKGIDQREKIVG